MPTNEPDRSTVLDALKRAFPHDWQHVYDTMHWSTDGCWLIDYRGICVGIEPDGYIHS